MQLHWIGPMIPCKYSANDYQIYYFLINAVNFGLILVYEWTQSHSYTVILFAGDWEMK